MDSLNSQDDRGWTALHYAVRGKNPEIPRYLIKQGAKLDLQDNEGQTPLHLAAASVKRDVILMLLEGGATANLKTRDGKTVADLALAAGAESGLVQLIEMYVELQSEPTSPHAGPDRQNELPSFPPSAPA